MINAVWYVYRLKAMNVGEIRWRIQQKLIQKKERKQYFKKHLPVIEVPLELQLLALTPDVKAIDVVDAFEKVELFTELDIFNGSFSYKDYRKKWNAGFQTQNTWPEDQFSYDINCGGRVDIGDIRTNWELNRHFQFAALAKNYYVTGEERYLSELDELFYDWNQHSLFLHGVEWTSAMEIAIRVNSWIFTYCFVSKVKDRGHEVQLLLNKLSQGILVMTDYIIKHLSRYSSANNHLIVELYAVGLSGFFYNYEPWYKLSIEKLTEELPRQNYSDGVNKEMSLHYQGIVMEAYGLLMVIMKKNNFTIPKLWIEYLSKMSEFLADCYGDYGETIVFGDSDEGKILDLVGISFDYYRYVLNLMSCILPKCYSDLDMVHENIKWLFRDSVIQNVKTKDKYRPHQVKCYREGGYTLIRDNDRGVLIGIDHADLGFGALAAHGHADALSFQMYVKGIPLFVDAGTYNYHITPELRNTYRSTNSHNTASVGGEEQSEILGPFLWGNRASIEFIEFDERAVSLATRVCYNGITQQRNYLYKESQLIIQDEFTGVSDNSIQQNFLVNPGAEIIAISETKINVQLDNICISIENESDAKCKIEDYLYSESYCHQKEGKKIIFIGNGSSLVTRINLR